ncbi:MAG TPA: DUF3566 domain-containing protein [Actinomycetes bacterium]
MSSTSSGHDDRWRSAQQTATMPPVAAGAATSAASPHRVARKARLVFARVDPWSVMKLAFLLSVALGIVAVVAVAVLWSVLDTMGVFDAVGRTIDSVTKERSSDESFAIYQYVGFGKVMSITMVLCMVNVVLLTALSTLASFLYNLASSLVGGLHITFTEDV